jgi:large subunit ribosomal protein L15
MIKKRKKASRQLGRNMGTHGGGARKKRKGSGHRGGIGMSGTGKRADHKKTLMTKLYGNSYFGKQGITSRGTKRDTRKRINVGELEKYKNEKGEVNLKNYKILGKGEVKSKLIITAKEASKSAIEKIKEKGGEIVLPVLAKKVDTKPTRKKKKEMSTKGKEKVVKEIVDEAPKGVPSEEGKEKDKDEPETNI